MYYIALLRVANVLKWLAIVLAAICVIHGIILAMYPVLVNSDTTSDDIPLPLFFALAGLFAAMLASRFARSLSEENESHLPVTFTKPASRAHYALGMMAVDALGILAAFVMLFVADVILTAQHQALGHVVVTPDSGIQLFRYLALPFAFYGVLTALTARLGHAARGVIGWSWGAAFILVLLSAIDLEPWRSIVALVNTVNPLSYSAYSYHTAHDTVNIVGSFRSALTPALDFLALAVLSVAGIVVGIWQWHRVEA